MGQESCHRKIGHEINGERVNQTDQFVYLGSWVMEDGELECELQSRLQRAGRVWNNISGVMYDKPRRLKAQLYSAVVRPAVLNGAGAWVIEAAGLMPTGV